MSAARDAEQMVAEVRDDPEARIRLAADSYALRGVGRPYRPYRRAVVAFMRWQQARGVLNALDADAPGSPWWRSVNEDLLRDTLEAKLLVEREDVVSVATQRAALGRLLPRTIGALVVPGPQRERRRRIPQALGPGRVGGAGRAVLHERGSRAGAVRTRAACSTQTSRSAGSHSSPGSSGIRGQGVRKPCCR